MNPEQNGGQVPPQNVQPAQPGQNPPHGMPGHDPYAFILNPEKPAKKPLALPIPTGNSVLGRVALAVGGLFVLVILVVIALSIFTSGSKEKTASLLSIAQYQTELVRVATDASTHSTSIAAQNLAQDIKASVTSDNIELVTYMKDTGQKISASQLALKHSKTTDATLTSAIENNTYDTAFKDIVQTDLGSYISALKKAYDANPGQKGKALLSKQYSSAELLLKVSKQ